MEERQAKNITRQHFAAPHITATIIEFICTNDSADRNAVIQYLKSKAKNVYSEKIAAVDYRIRPFMIRKACIFPFNKEVQTLARFDKILDFELLHYYDIKYLGNCGKKISCILEDTQSNKIVENIERIDWNENFDTFILGHTDKIHRLVKRNYADWIINKCLEYGKNLFVFDDFNINTDIIQAFVDKGLDIYFPSVHNKFFSSQSGKLYSFSTPILSVFGTSSRQGKFTLQLNIKHILSEQGYSVGFLGTEPTSLLLGADEDYTTGYNSDIYRNSTENIIRLNKLIHDIDKKQKDIILLGSQSHTVPMGYSNIGMFTLYQQDILFAAPPDACILCVNYYDDISYIKRSINYLESVCETTVILLCVSTFGGASRWSTYGTVKVQIDTDLIAESKKKFSSAFNIPVFMYNELQDICFEVIEFFSEDK